MSECLAVRDMKAIPSPLPSPPRRRRPKNSNKTGANKFIGFGVGGAWGGKKMAALSLKISKFVIIFQVMEPQNTFTHEHTKFTSHLEPSKMISFHVYPVYIIHLIIILIVNLRNSPCDVWAWDLHSSLIILCLFKATKTFQWAIFAFQSNKKKHFLFSWTTKVCKRLIVDT